MLSHMTDLLEKRSELFLRAEILDQGRAIQGAFKDDSDVAREVPVIKHFLAQSMVRTESSTKTRGNGLCDMELLLLGKCAPTIFIHELSSSMRRRTIECSERVSFLLHRVP